MSKFNIKTFIPGSEISDFQIFFLSKGLNAGKPLEAPCPNCFVFKCESMEQVKLYKSIGYILWRKQSYIPYLTGSVIPFIRIDDFREIFSLGIEQIKDNSRLTQILTQLQAFEELEKAYIKNLSLIQEAKKALYSKMFNL
ncbi:hypothetical protein MCERE19_01427 [Spirosomataceae bacterium]|jgi:hypothetical protein